MGFEYCLADDSIPTRKTQTQRSTAWHSWQKRDSCSSGFCGQADPATSGTVRYDERDLYDNYDELRHRIGFVPQDDILHTPLTVRRALNYAARLRFPQAHPLSPA